MAENIDHEAWLAHHLKSLTEYQFRLLAMNKIGWSRPGFHTQTVKTKIGGTTLSCIENFLSPTLLRP